MLYCEIMHGITAMAVTNKIPVEGSSVPARPDIISLQQFRIAQSHRHGGMVNGEYGTMTLVPQLFLDVTAAGESVWWPPPQVLDQIVIGWYPDDGSAYWGVPLVFNGWLESVSPEGIVYSLRSRDGYEETATDRWYNGTLANAHSEIAAALGLTANYGWARSPSPDVDYRASGERSVISNLTELCAFFTHKFFISGTSVYLIDCLADAGSGGAIILTSADIKSVEYLQPEPVKRVSAVYNPPSVKRIKLEIQERQDGGTSVVAAEFDISKYVGGALINPDALTVSDYQTGYPSTNLWDDDAATLWISGTGTVPGVTLTAQVVYGELCEYAITAPLSSPIQTPSRWSLYGYNGWTGVYEYVAEVESLDWTAGEQRRFAVPNPISWRIEVDNLYSGTYLLGDDYDVGTVCHTNHTLITDACENILTEVTKLRCRYILPIQEVFPGQRLQLTDTMTIPGATITSWIRAESITFDFDQGTVAIEGGGGWA